MTDRAPLAVVLVEGVSDRIALETLAVRRGRDLVAERVEVVDMNGAHAARHFLTTWGPMGAGLRLAGLYDAAEESVIMRAVAAAGIGTASTRADLERLGFFACSPDLEAELIKAHGATVVETLVAAQGDLASFRALQGQPQWRGRPLADQLHRFFGSGSRRKHRYARVLVDALDLGRVPGPLDAALSHGLAGQQAN